ncbi:MAG: hypothetical protein J6D20_00265 [Clostridia bacterium]|nr:hypothetical protein [Clostridia bacterium]
MQNNRFEYKYSVPTERERREIESIKRQYTRQDDITEANKLMHLRRLHNSIANTARLVALIIGIAGTLIFGGGMALVMEFSQLGLGIAVSAIGIIPMALAYPVYKLVFNLKKKKHGDEILRLSDELLGNDGEA